MPPLSRYTGIAVRLAVKTIRRDASSTTRPPDNTKCDGRHTLCVSYLTETRVLSPYNSPVTRLPTVTHGDMEAGMLVRTFVHLTTQAVVVAAVLMLALPFFLALATPFIGR
jgi:hypothetical protein